MNDVTVFVNKFRFLFPPKINHLIVTLTWKEKHDTKKVTSQLLLFIIISYYKLLLVNITDDYH